MKKSIRGRLWSVSENNTGIVPTAKTIISHHNSNDSFQLSVKGHEVLIKRGITTDEQLQKYFFGRVRDFFNPSNPLSDVDIIVDILSKAIKDKKRLGMLGDYDVDGATSTAIWKHFLLSIGHDNVTFHIPDRMSEGYGLSKLSVTNFYNGKKVIRKAEKDDVGNVIKDAEYGECPPVDVMIVLDSGTLSFDEVKLAKTLSSTGSHKMDVVIIDHHDPKLDSNGNDLLPECPVVNPKKQIDEHHEMQHMCTAGLAFMITYILCEKLISEGYVFPDGFNKNKLFAHYILPVAVLGTIADMMKLQTINHALVKNHIKDLKRVPGILKIATEMNRRKQQKNGGKKMYDITLTKPEDCGFSIGPVINACGRIADSYTGTRILTEHEIDDMVKKAVTENEIRKDMTKTAEKICDEEMRKLNAIPEVIVIENEEFHPGIVGLAASRLKNKYNRSAVVIGKGGKGSARSANGYNIGHAFHKATDAGIILKGGGHAAAAGLTADMNKIGHLREFLNEDSNVGEQPMMVDMELTQFPSIDMVKEIEDMGPYGQGNPRPRIILRNALVTGIKPLGQVGMQISVQAGKTRGKCKIWCDPEERDVILAMEKQKVDIIGILEENTFFGTPGTPEISIDDIILN